MWLKRINKRHFTFSPLNNQIWCYNFRRKAEFLLFRGWTNRNSLCSIGWRQSVGWPSRWRRRASAAAGMSSRWCGRWASLRGTSWSCRRRQAPERTSSGSGASPSCVEGGVPAIVGTGSEEKNTFYERKFLYCNTRLRLIMGWNRLFLL